MKPSDPVTSTIRSLSAVTSPESPVIDTVAFVSVGTATTVTDVVPLGTMMTSPSSTSVPCTVNVASEVSTVGGAALAALIP